MVLETRRVLDIAAPKDFAFLGVVRVASDEVFQVNSAANPGKK
jgi:hypothetical protein